jgi:hypothetical protein
MMLSRASPFNKAKMPAPEIMFDLARRNTVHGL